MRQGLVLIVEDEPDNREIMRAVVEDMVGCRASLAGDGLGAISKAREEPPSLDNPFDLDTLEQKIRSRVACPEGDQP